MIEQTPGVVMSRQNVGGTASGQQYSWVARGGGTANAMWNLDGATITDMADSTSPMYYDFDSFQEIQIQTGGNDASLETGGVNINFITKSGSNVFRGSGRFMIVDEALQSSNVDAGTAGDGRGRRQPGEEHPGLRLRTRRARSSRTGCGSGAASASRTSRSGCIGFLQARGHRPQRSRTASRATSPTCAT